MKNTASLTQQNGTIKPLTTNPDGFPTYREVAKGIWLSSLRRQLLELLEEFTNPPSRVEITAEIDPTALDKMIVGRSPFASIRQQLSELIEERLNPPLTAEITADADPSALDKLIEAKSPFTSIFYQLKSIVADLVHPTKIEITAEPVDVREIWSKRRRRAPATLTVTLHLLAIALVFFPVRTIQKTQVSETFVPLYLTLDLALNLPQEDDDLAGGGGGGLQQETPPSLGELPRADDQQFVPPTPEPLNLDPILVAEPTVVAPSLANPEQMFNLALLGSPDGIPAPPSSGPGIGGGIGTGRGRGVGEGRGPGVGEGEGGGFGGGVFEVGGGVTSPTILFRVDPIYPEEARKALYEGTVVLEAIVRKDGSIDILRVIRGLGFGLDENAVKALKLWKFRPGMRRGVPVDVALNIEINFHLR